LDASGIPQVLTVYDMQGRSIEQIKYSQKQGQIMIDVHSYPTGMYFYKSSGDRVFKGKFIVR
jgi:hypothetical protein